MSILKMRREKFKVLNLIEKLIQLIRKSQHQAILVCGSLPLSIVAAINVDNEVLVKILM